MKTKNTLTLIDWIDREGPSRVAKMLKINPGTVRVWYRGEGLPYARQMFEIKKLTKGRVNYDTMIDSFFKGGAND